MGTVRLKDRLLHMGEFAEKFDRSFSALQVSAEMLKYNHTLIRFSNKIEFELSHTKLENEKFIDQFVCLLRISFNQFNEVKTMSIYTNDGDVSPTDDFSKIIEVMDKLLINIAQEEIA